MKSLMLAAAVAAACPVAAEAATTFTLTGSAFVVFDQPLSSFTFGAQGSSAFYVSADFFCATGGACTPGSITTGEPYQATYTGAGTYTFPNFSSQQVPAGYTFTTAYFTLASQQGPVTIGINADGMAVAPEPTSWAMMIVGFGLVGASLRRRRTAVRLA